MEFGLEGSVLNPFKAVKDGGRQADLSIREAR